MSSGRHGVHPADCPYLITPDERPNESNQEDWGEHEHQQTAEHVVPAILLVKEANADAGDARENRANEGSEAPALCELGQQLGVELDARISAHLF